MLPQSTLGIPILGIGIGTSHKKKSDDPANEHLVSILFEAAKNGFIHLDSAEAYGNDEELKLSLQKMLQDTHLEREDIFITDKYFSGNGLTKIPLKSYTPYDRIKYILNYLDTPYIDLYLLHSPFIEPETHGFTLKEAWKYMQQAYDEGLVKRIGVSNFAVEDIEGIWDTTKTNPQVNQIEFNVFLQEQTPGIVKYCQSKGITIEAYSPLSPLTRADLESGIGLDFSNLLEELSKKYERTELQILLRWVIQQGIIPITTTSKPERFKEFQGVFGWQLSQKDVESISNIGLLFKGNVRKCWLQKYGKYD